MKPIGQGELRHLITGVATAALIGGGAFIWNAIRPSEDRAVEQALLKKAVEDQGRKVSEHDAVLKVLVPQVQRIEDVVVRIDERGSGVRPASGKR